MLIHGATDNDIHPPRAGGTQRSFGLYRGLARRHEVRVLCVVPNRDPAPREETVEGVRLSRRKVPYTSLLWRGERWGLAPLWSAAWLHARRDAGWRRELGGEADVVMADIAHLGMFDGSGSALRVYHSQNVESDHFESLAPPLLGRAAWARRLREWEGRAVGKADLVICVSDEDARRFAELHGAPADRFEVIPNGYDERLLRTPSTAEREAARAALGIGAADYVALFVGSDHPHNLAALRWLADTVMPRAAAAGVRLLAVGGTTRTLEGRREAWLTMRPEVPDLLPFLHAADAGLNPVTLGGGSNVKIPTCLAAGLAVLSTTFGMRGFAPLAPWIVSVPPEQFADALAERPAGWHARREARPAAVADYAWGALGERLGRVLEVRRGAPVRREAVA